MSSRVPFLLVIAGLCSGSLLQAAEPTAVPPYELQNKSSFTATSPEKRAPFWPIGWTKRKVSAAAPQVQTPVEPKVNLDDSHFKVTSILLGNPSLAIINGKTYSEGEFIRTPRVAATANTPAASTIPAGARIRVYRINDGQVVLQHQDQLITVGLKRPELVQKREEEQLLTEDRP